MTRAPEKKTPNAGTCAICGGVWMLVTRGPNKGKLVNHGFERPWGQAEQTTGCYGEKSEPYEVSTEVLARYQEVLKQAHEFATKGLANLQAGPDELHEISMGFGNMKRVAKGDPAYEALRRRKISEAESHIRHIEHDQKRTQQKLDNWPGAQPLKYKDPSKRGGKATLLAFEDIKVGEHYKLHRELVQVVEKVADDGRRGFTIRTESGREYWIPGSAALRAADPEFVAKRKQAAEARRKRIARRKAMETT